MHGDGLRRVREVARQAFSARDYRAVLTTSCLDSMPHVLRLQLPKLSLTSPVQGRIAMEAMMTPRCTSPKMMNTTMIA